MNFSLLTNQSEILKMKNKKFHILANLALLEVEDTL